MRASLFSVACLICLAQAATSPSVFAQTAQASGADPQIAQARARFEEGIKAYDAGKYEQARVAFLETYALKKDPGVLLNLAFSSLKSGHALDAQKYFKQFLAGAPSTATKERAAASDGLKEADAALGHIEVTGPAKAVVVVDGAEVGPAPLAEPVGVDPGEHTVTLKSADGSISQTLHVSVRGGEKAAARFKDAGGSSEGGAGEAKPESSAAPAASDGEKAAANAAPAPAEATTPKDSGGPGPLSPPTNIVPALLLGGVAVVGYAFAIGFFVSEGSANDNVNKDKQFIIANGSPGMSVNCSSPPPNFVTVCHALNNDQSAANTDTVVAGIGLGVGIAATAGAIVYWVLADKGGSKTGAAHLPVVAPLVGAGTGGLTVSGSF